MLSLAAALFAVAVAGKLASVLGMWGSPGDRLLVGIGMIPRGEVGLIFANLGLADSSVRRMVVDGLDLIVMLFRFGDGRRKVTRITEPYFADGTYLPAGLSRLNAFLRDFRTGQAHAIDPGGCCLVRHALGALEAADLEQGGPHGRQQLRAGAVARRQERHRTLEEGDLRRQVAAPVHPFGRLGQALRRAVRERQEPRGRRAQLAGGKAVHPTC